MGPVGVGGAPGSGEHLAAVVQGLDGVRRRVSGAASGASHAVEASLLDDSHERVPPGRLERDVPGVRVLGVPHRCADSGHDEFDTVVACAAAAALAPPRAGQVRNGHALLLSVFH